MRNNRYGAFDLNANDYATLSRRMLLRNAVAMIGAVAALAITGTQAIAKMAQKAAGYQITPKADQSCATCALFKAPSSCTLVDGEIAAAGWCRFFAKKTG
jgi:hypothetical protein